MLADALAKTIADADPVLVPPTAIEPLLERARSVSGAAAYLECRPVSEKEQVDLLVCLISAEDPRPSGPVSLRAGRGWSLATILQRERRRLGGELQKQSPLLWLEFDDAGRADNVAAPSVCVCVEPTYLSTERCLNPNPHSEETACHVAELAGISADDVAAMYRCIRALPRESHLIHLSLMCERAGGATKLYARVPLEGAVAYLDDIGWAGDHGALEDLLDWRRGKDRFLHLDLTVEGGQIAGRLAVAFPRANDGQRFALDVFDGLAARCLPASRILSAREAGKKWVATQPTVKTPGGWAHIAHRWIDQKIVFDQGECELKFYLAVRPLPFLFGAMASAGGSS